MTIGVTCNFEFNTQKEKKIEPSVRMAEDVFEYARYKMHSQWIEICLITTDVDISR